MDALHLSPTPDSINPPYGSDPVAEAIHLRRLIEALPFCLMRVAMDGVLLAANDAALGLLGARDLHQVLGSEVTAWMVAGNHDRWREFAATLANGTSGSLECELMDLSGNHRTVLFHGVPLLDHADGIPSMMLGTRDISVSRRIETALQAGESDRPQPAPQQVEQVEAQRVGLDQLERLLREGRTHLQNLRTQLQQTVSERDRLATQLEETETAHQRQMVAQAAEEAQRQRTLAEQHERDLSVKDQEAQQQVDDLQAQLEASAADRDQLTGFLKEAENAHRHFATEVSAERAERDRVLETARLTQKQMAKELADHRVELQSMDLGMRQLAPLAASGRMALEVGHGLWKVAETIDARASGLLTQSSLEAASRSEIEALRSEAMQARSLASQILQAKADASVPPKSTIGDPDASNLSEEHT